MFPGSLPNPISFDQYYYSCFLRDGSKSEPSDGNSTESHSFRQCTRLNESPLSDTPRSIATTLPANRGSSRSWSGFILSLAGRLCRFDARSRVM
jgi:hypothetical protein